MDQSNETQQSRCNGGPLDCQHCHEHVECDAPVSIPTQKSHQKSKTNKYHHMNILKNYKGITEEIKCNNDMLGCIYFCSRTPIESSPAIMNRNTCSCTVLTRIQLCRANFAADTLAGIAIHTLRHAASTCIRTAVEDACSIWNARGPTFTIFHQSAEQNEKCCFEQKEKKWEPQFLELESHRYSADYEGAAS